MKTDRRVRIASVRLSEQEYSLLEEHAKSRGVPTVSDFLRGLLVPIVSGVPTDFTGDLAELRERVSKLESVLFSDQDFHSVVPRGSILTPRSAGNVNGDAPAKAPS
jgi:hypothetical protein